MHGYYHDEIERLKWQNPEQILIDIGLNGGDRFIDVGCGNGFFSIPAAKIVGNKGIIYAIDVNKEAIDIIRKKAKKQELNNLILKIGKAEDTVFCNLCADIVFFGINLHDFDNPKKVLINAKKMLKPEGKLVDLNWKKEYTEIGPPINIRFDKQKATNLIRSVGFKVESIEELQYHYLIIARK